MTADPLAYLRAIHAEAEAEAEAARDFDYAGCGIWEARGPYPAACGEADGVSRPRGNIRTEIGRDDIFLEAELPWALIPHMARHNPAAVLRRIAADRKLLERHQAIDCKEFGCDCDSCCVTCRWTESDERDTEPPRMGPDPHVYPCPTVRILAEGWGWTEETT